MFLLTYLILQYIKQITIFLTEIDKQTASDIWVTINIVSVYFSVALNNELLKETTLEYPSTLQISRRHFVLEHCSAGFSFSGAGQFLFSSTSSDYFDDDSNDGQRGKITEIIVFLFPVGRRGSVTRQ